MIIITCVDPCIGVAALRARRDLPDWVAVHGYVDDVDDGLVTRH